MCRVEDLVMMFPQEEEMGELQRPPRQQRIYLRQHLMRNNSLKALQLRA